MGRRIKVYIFTLIFLFVPASKVYAECSDVNLMSSPLKIFTPYHTVRSVYSPYEEKTEQVFIYSRKLQRQFTRDEIELIAKVVHAESQGEPFEGKIGVAAVILNRLEHPDFPKSIEDVVYQRNAFTCVRNLHVSAVPDSQAYDAVNEALEGKDPTGSAVFFYNPRTASNEWIKETEKQGAITIGNHIFFR
jgi:N-acetylmuramoyl-L-alanine amidase